MLRSIVLALVFLGPLPALAGPVTSGNDLVRWSGVDYLGTSYDVEFSDNWPAPGGLDDSLLAPLMGALATLMNGSAPPWSGNNIGGCMLPDCDIYAFNTAALPIHVLTVDTLGAVQGPVTYADRNAFWATVDADPLNDTMAHWSLSATVPAPGTMALLMLGVAGLRFSRRRISLPRVSAGRIFQAAQI